MEEDDVEDNGPEDGQAEHREEINQQEQATDDLTEKNDFHVTGRGDGREELAGGAIGRRRRAHRDEMKKAVEPENDEAQSEECAYNDRENFHGRSLRLPRGKAKRKHSDRWLQQREPQSSPYRARETAPASLG